MATVRPISHADVPRVLKLIADVFVEYGCVLNTDEDAYLLDPGAHFRAQGGEFWVVEDAGEIIATVAVVLHEDAGELKCMYVHSDHRRQGWGRRLSELTLEYARRAGKRRMVLWSDTRFLAAHGLYRAMGFTQGGVRELHDSNHTVEYGFELALAPLGTDG